MKYFLVIVAIICMVLFVGAQEKLPPDMRDYTDDINADPAEQGETYVPEPTVLPVTRLSVTIIDEVSNQLLRLENCVVQVLGELHIAEDSFNYSNTFVEGDRYEMTIHIKLKK